MRRLLLKALSMAAIGLLLAVAVGHGGGLYWFFDIFANFQIQYLMLGAAILLPALLLRQWRTAALSLAALGISLFTILQVSVQEEGGVAAPVPTLTVASYNVLFNNPVKDAAVKFAAAEQPDIIVFQEFSASYLPSLEKLRERYPHQAVFTLRNGGTDVVLVSRYELIEPRLVNGADRRIRILTADIEIEGQRLRLIGLHPPVPLLPRLAEIRDRHFEIVTELVKTSPHPTILIGDFNATLWGAPIRKLFARTSLRTHTHWPELTFATIFPWPTRIAIDHVLVTPRLQIAEFRKAEPFGSDHFPVVARIAIDGLQLHRPTSSGKGRPTVWDCCSY